MRLLSFRLVVQGLSRTTLDTPDLVALAWEERAAYMSPAVSGYYRLDETIMQTDSHLRIVNQEGVPGTRQNHPSA